MKALDILNRLQDEQPMYFENEVTEAIAELEELYSTILSHSNIAHRALLIGEDEGWFEWKGYEENGGWHSSLYNDFIKIRDNKPMITWMYLQNKKEDAYLKRIAELEALQEQLSTNDLQLGCDGCKWFHNDGCQECMSYCSRGWSDKYEPKDSE